MERLTLKIIADCVCEHLNIEFVKLVGSSRKKNKHKDIYNNLPYARSCFCIIALKLMNSKSKSKIGRFVNLNHTMPQHNYDEFNDRVILNSTIKNGVNFAKFNIAKRDVENLNSIIELINRKIGSDYLLYDYDFMYYSAEGCRSCNELRKQVEGYKKRIIELKKELS